MPRTVREETNREVLARARAARLKKSTPETRSSWARVASVARWEKYRAAKKEAAA